ncbi:MAG: nitroreductase [Ruminococcus sp.]|jgi:nitroreductase|uniref:nitroreductase n=1 Tax=uncultured Ruminococcus sp. TaxID=165186 RepID=UPI001B3D0292|nr:nitroreductase [uncultured Ruminococcus sp.]MBE6867646.1 nitroreductase family protein [Ruminococcus albus]MBP5267436.1 nitroreductase [Ruminococcus sp.]
MSEVMDKIITRRSVRAFTDEMPTEEQLETILKAGTFAATGMNRQSPIMIAVTDKKVRDELSAMNARIMGKDESFDPFYGAPAVIIVLADKSVGTYIYDGSLVMGNLMLAAHDVGLGSCWIHRAKEEFESEEGKALLAKLGITGDYEGIGHCVVGHIKGDYPAEKPRKENYVYYIK